MGSLPLFAGLWREAAGPGEFPPVISSGRVGHEMAVAPAVFLLEALLEDVQSGGCEPGSDLVTPGVVVVAADIAVDDFTAYGREPASGEGGERVLDHRLGHFFAGQVEEAAGARRPVQVRQHVGPIFGRDVLYRVDGQDRVDLAVT